MTTQAMQEAVEALERASGWLPTGGTLEAVRGAIISLKAALRVEQQPAHPLQPLSDLTAALLDDEGVQPSTDALDARRYRWLRDKSEPGICAFYLSVGDAFKGVRFIPSTVDEAIDAQIAAIDAMLSAKDAK